MSDKYNKKTNFNSLFKMKYSYNRRKPSFETLALIVFNVFFCWYIYTLLFVGNHVVEEEIDVDPNSILGTLMKRAQHLKSICEKSQTKEEGEIKLNLSISLDRKVNKYKRAMRYLGVVEDVIIIPDKDIAFCPIPKVGSKTISRAILDITNIKKVNRSIHPELVLRSVYSKFDLENLMKVGDGMKSFAIIRDPFERFVSLYLTFTLSGSDPGEDDYFDNLYNKILEEKEGDFSLLFLNDQDSRKEFEKKQEALPTFIEFVDYFMNKDPDYYSRYFRPIWNSCQFCKFDYDYIIKYERLGVELKVMTDHLKEIGTLPPDFEIDLETLLNESLPVNKEITESYIKALSSYKIHALYEIYKKDFINFNYSHENYFID